MKPKQLPTSTATFSLIPQPASAWMAILMLSFLTGVLILVGGGKILNFAFPIGAVFVGLLLYLRYPILYVGFTWWMWFLSPLIRRLADYQNSFTDPSPILLTPYLVTLITMIAFWQNLPKSLHQGGLPFVLSAVSLFYAFIVGLIYRIPINAAIALLDWLTPVIFGFYLFLNWRNYPQYRQNIQRVFAWAILLMGIYGIFQYLILPEWDRFWLMNAGINSIGKPIPMEFRIWSTLNSGEPFAGFMAAGLLLLFNSRELIGFPAAIFGYIAFLLAMIRSAWGGWLLGLITLVTSLKPQLQMRLIITLMVMVLLILPLVTTEPFSTVILQRFTSFSNLENDHSANVRKEIYGKLFDSAITSWFGKGLGGEGFDSNILSLLLDLGWLGTLFYLAGLLMLVFICIQSCEISSDPFIIGTRAGIISVLVRIPLNYSLLEISGLVLWAFLGITLAAKKYYHYQKNSRILSSNLIS